MSHYRSAALRAAVAALILFTSVSAYSASSVPTAGHTGQALALQTSLHQGPAQSFLQNRDLYLPAAGRHRTSLEAMRARALRRPRRGLHPNASAPAAIPIDEGVQTFDVFAPLDNDFVPADGTLTATNLTPVWTSDQNYIVFASNLAGDGHTHLFAISSNGDLTGQTASLRQITTGSGDEAFPALNTSSTALAFTSTAANGTPNLYVIPFNIQTFSGVPGTAINPTTQTSLTIRTDLTTGFGAVGRPTWSADGKRIAFAAVDSAGMYSGRSHIWYLYIDTDGYLDGSAPTPADPPAKLTTGPANDTDPAWSPDGNYIAFASTATGISTSSTQITPATPPTTTTGSQAVRNLFLISGGTTASQSVFGTVPTASNFDGHVTNSTTVDDFGPAWSSAQTTPVQSSQYLNPTSSFEYLAWGRGASPTTPHDIDYLRLTELDNNVAVVTAEGQTTPGGSVNAAVKLNTDDNAGETSTTGNVYNDIYPTWSPFLSVFSIAYSSNRSVTYNSPTTNAPLETAVSLADGATGVGAGYSGILQSQVLNLDPPLLLPFGGGNVVQVTNASGVVTRQIQPGETATFTVRLSDREAGTDPNNVYLQLKDPNSKYQDAQNLEHKVYTKDGTSYIQNPDSYPNPATTFNPAFEPAIGSASFYLYNAGLGDGFNVLNSVDVPQRGAVAGIDGSDTISVGTYTGTGNLSFTGPVSVDETQYIPYGQEYECQVVNPGVANPDTGTGDFTTPYYLAGIDDNVAFSGISTTHPASSHPPRPTANAAGTPTAAAVYAQWIKLAPAVTGAGGVPVPDASGGVLYTGTYTTPSAFGSDFYLDVIAYDNAAFPALPSDTSSFVGQSKNWRIYDNVGGFTTTPFDGSNDILVVSDNTLGQKFAAGTFGGRDGSSDLLPVFYGAESYYTDVDVSLLPNCVYFSSAPATSPAPPNVPAPVSQAAPTNLSATPGNALVTLVWTGVLPAPTGGYNIYRSRTPAITAFGGAASPNFLANVSGTAVTSYVDRAVQNGTTFYYEVTAVNGTGGTNESVPTNEASTTPFVPGTTPVAQVQGLTPFVGNVLNGLGVGSYDDGQIDDGRTVDGRPDVQSQRYSIWRILSRGPVPASVLQAYSPTFVAQPAVTDPVTGLQAVAANGTAAPLVPVANRCVIWASPYTGDLLIGAGSILDSSTQTLLKAFVQGGTVGTTTLAGGGRLFVSGQDVGSAITQSGSVNNSVANGDFLPSVLNATLTTAAGGTQVLTGGAAAGNRISFDAFFNENTGAGIDQDFPVLNSNLTLTYLAPAQSPVFELSNNYFDVINDALMERTDSAMDQIGPANYRIGSSLVQGQIDTVTAQNGAHTDINFGGPGTPGLVYNENTATGGRTVYASFGLESLGIEYYKVSNNNINYYSPRNLRPDILHNIVCYLRTGNFSGTIRQTGQGGAGVPGATVYLQSNGGVPIPGNPAARQVYSATTDSSGNYLISGVEPGAYTVIAYKNGYNRATSASVKVSFSVEGDNSTVVNLNLNPVPGGVFSGKVTDGTNGVAGALVSFVSADGQTTLTATTDAGGNYSVVNVPPGSYTGTASKVPQYGSAPPTQGNPVAVTSGATTTANFVLAAAPGTVNGVVSDSATGAGIVGATVTFTPSTGGAALTATTVAASGATPAGFYTISLPAAGYTVSAAKTGYITSAGVVFTLTPGATLTENIALTVAPKPAPGTLGGLVADSATGKPVGGATVTLTTTTPTGGQVTDINGVTVGPVTTTATTTSPAAPTGDGSPQNYAFTNLAAGTYTVTVTDSGYGKQALTTQVVVAGAFTRSDFTSANGNPLQPVHVFPAGYNFFSVPYDYAAAGIGIDTVLGTLNTGTLASPSAGSNRSHLFVWSPILLQYLLDPTPPADGLRLGQGYWVYLLGVTEVTTVGNLPTTTTIPVALQQGWNQIGVPSLTPVMVASLTFANASGGGAISFANASASTYHIVSGTLYGYNGSSYVAVTGTGSVQPWQSYWIYAFANSTVMIPTGGG